jgi:hypothetical protein
VKYFPLVWSALRRKPVDAALTGLAVTVAFALFGLMLGVNATVRATIEAASADTVFVSFRFPSVRLQVGMRDQIARIRGVSAVAVFYQLWGRNGDQPTATHVMSYDEAAREAVTYFGLKPEHWNRLFATRDGLYVSRKEATRYHLEAGDTFVVTTDPGMRADGGQAWTFHVLDILPDAPTSGGFMIANGIAQSVRQRIPEFAMLKTIGFRNAHIMGLVFAEATLPCLAGALIGTLLATQLLHWPAKSLPAEFAGLPTPTLSLDTMLCALAAAAVIACVSAAAPLVWVSRMSVVSQLARPGK